MTNPTSQRVARNGALYFVSLALPAIAAVFLVPVTVAALGVSRFGLLALAWAVAEGAGMFDFGLARTTVRFVADATARGPDRLREILLTSVLSQSAAGLLAGMLLFALAPTLVTDVFTISGPAIPEAIAMFRVLALHVPVLLAAAALRAAFEGAQRFDISTALRVPGSLASVAIPALAASAGASLPTIMWLLLAIRVALVVISAIAVTRVLLPGGWAIPAGAQTMREMLGYSGWVGVSAALGPALGSFDRFVVGSVIGVAALGYYTGAAEAANRFLLIPATAFAAVLPALAHTEARGARALTLAGMRSARRQLAAVLFPLCLALFAFAPAILVVWLGFDFGEQAGTALRILSVGVFLGGLAHLPMAVLYGAGRPDIPAKIHIVEVLLYLPFTFAVVRMWGITGAALAWTVRCGVDWISYEWATRVAIGRSHADAAEAAHHRRLLAQAVSLTIVSAAAVWLATASWFAAIGLFTLGFVAYVLMVWSRVLSAEERRAWSRLLKPAHPGSLQDQPSGIKYLAYFWLTRSPRAYLLLEARRRLGNWDKRVYLSFVRRGDFVVDVGANYGGHSLFFSHLVGRAGRVVAFEPVPESFAALQENVKTRSRFRNITVVQAAVGRPASPSEVALINVPGSDFGQASRMIQTAHSWEQDEEIHQYACPMTSLDSNEVVQSLARIDFVKIDVEGGELDVLKGAAQTLTGALPLLYCEVYEKWTTSFGYGASDLLELGRSFGYTDARVISKGIVQRLRLGDPVPDGWFDTSSDVLFFTAKHADRVALFDQRFSAAGK